MVDKLAVFQGKHIRRILHDGEWWFSVIDIIEVLVGSERPRKYWSDLKKKLLLEGYDQLSEKIGQLKLQSTDGKFYATDCANTETMFRIIQSIPSPKVEPLKRWLARAAKERIYEIENPELSMERMKELYEKKVYPDQRDHAGGFRLEGGGLQAGERSGAGDPAQIRGMFLFFSMSSADPYFYISSMVDPTASLTADPNRCSFAQTTVRKKYDSSPRLHPCRYCRSLRNS